MARKPFVTVDVRGLPQLLAGSEELFDRIGETAGQRLGRVADQAAGDTRMNVPHRSGRLAASVSSRLAKSERKSSVRIGGRVPYAGWIEFGGTRGRPYIPGGRYLYPTALGAEPRAVVACNQAATDEIRSMRWPTPS